MIQLPLLLKSDQAHAIREHGRRTFPYECCGFLVGRDVRQERQVVRVEAALNIRGDQELHNRFTISPEAFIKADKAARTDQLDIVGFYHSHPNAPPLPSPYDVEQAWPVYSYVIVSVLEGDPDEMTCWVLDEDRSGFSPQQITVCPES